MRGVFLSLALFVVVAQTPEPACAAERRALHDRFRQGPVPIEEVVRLLDRLHACQLPQMPTLEEFPTTLPAPE